MDKNKNLLLKQNGKLTIYFIMNKDSLVREYAYTNYLNQLLGKKRLSLQNYFVRK